LKTKFKNENEMPLTTENLDNFEDCIIVGTATAILIGIAIFLLGVLTAS